MSRWRRTISIASIPCRKPITAVAAMQLYEKGLFTLDDPVSKFIPEFKDLKVWQAEGEPVEPARPMTMRHLLTHTAGFAYVFERHPVVGLYAQRQVLGSTDLEEMITKLADIPLRLHPGERWYYSVAVDVTGAVVERLSGKTFDKYLHEHLFVPLQMPDTFFLSAKRQAGSPVTEPQLASPDRDESTAAAGME